MLLRQLDQAVGTKLVYRCFIGLVRGMIYVAMYKRDARPAIFRSLVWVVSQMSA